MEKRKMERKNGRATPETPVDVKWDTPIQRTREQLEDLDRVYKEVSQAKSAFLSGKINRDQIFLALNNAEVNLLTSRPFYCNYLEILEYMRGSKRKDREVLSESLPTSRYRSGRKIIPFSGRGGAA